MIDSSTAPLTASTLSFLTWFIRLSSEGVDESHWFHLKKGNSSELYRSKNLPCYKVNTDRQLNMSLFNMPLFSSVGIDFPFLQSFENENSIVFNKYKILCAGLQQSQRPPPVCLSAIKLSLQSVHYNTFTVAHISLPLPITIHLQCTHHNIFAVHESHYPLI